MAEISKYLKLFLKYKRLIIKNNTSLLLPLAFFFVAILIIHSQFKADRYISNEFGYEITIPPGWNMKIANSRKTLYIIKGADEEYGNTTIRIDVKFGNPYGNTALDYIKNGLVPQIEYTYHILDESVLVFRKKPTTKKRRSKIKWAMTSFNVDYDETQIIYVAAANDNIYQITFKATGSEQRKDERIFYKILDTFKLKQINQTNVFLK